MEITYRTEGDICLPNLTRDEKPGELTRFGRMRLQYLQEYQEGTYITLTLTCKLMEHLLGIQEQAEQQMDILMEQMAKKQGVTEELKAQDQMKWVRMMNSIQNAAEEIVKKELIYPEENRE